jgi:hypothetical protein
VRLSPAQAWALAQLVKRLGYPHCRGLAEDEDQAWLMLIGAERLRQALAEAGYAPR